MAAACWRARRSAPSITRSPRTASCVCSGWAVRNEDLDRLLTENLGDEEEALGRLEEAARDLSQRASGAR
ncbi:MAG TPA: hypothetical protein VG365_06715 [Solirubrobacteraceae bacterium]|nr:hypothetical protein [Solirubrobacteraceae bacterium]